jgi:hypothetical protein
MYDRQRLPALAEAIDGSSGALDLEHCRAAGMSEKEVRWRVESGRWQSPFPRALVTFSGPIPLVTLQEAALAYAGEGATLSRESCGAYWGLCAVPERIHVTVPYAREVEDQPGLKIHRSRTLRSDDVQPGVRPTRLRIELSVIDLLPGRRTVDQALALVADAIRTRRTTAPRLRAAIESRTRLRWRRQALLALPDLHAGAHSVLELHDAAIRRRHGLPAGKRQFRRRIDGTEFLDVYIEEFNVHVELDGRLGHDRALEIWRDFKRDNTSVVRRLRHLRYGWADVLGSPCDVAMQQAVVLRQEGWTGPYVRCRDCPPSTRFRADLVTP